MKLQLRFLVLLSFFFIAISALLLVQQNFESYRSQRIVASELSQRKNYFNNIVSLQSQSLERLSSDYSFWDDMVSFVSTQDKNFAKQSIDTGLSTFDADVSWVYNAQGGLVHTGPTERDTSIESITYQPAFFEGLKKLKKQHFYSRTADNKNIIEIYAATIVPSSDPSHTTSPKGYWIIGRVLDQNYINSITRLSQTTTRIAPATGQIDRNSGSAVIFYTKLSDWQGRSVAQLQSESQIALVGELDQQYKSEFRFLLLFGAAMLVAVSAALWWLVVRPLGFITESIREQRTDTLLRLTRSPTEFGELARTMMTFFKQKVQIEEGEFHKAELERLNKEKTAFLAVAAHELNGPIGNIRTFSEYLNFIFKTKPTDSEEIQKQLRRIGYQAKRIAMLVQDLHSASEGNEHLEFNTSLFNFEELVKEEVEQASFTTKQQLAIEGSANVMVSSDPDRFGQVINNLLRNAAKYSPDADTIIIRLKADEDTTTLEVQDFGLGITVEDQAHLFERFYRSNSVASAYHGLGLGLSICQQIITDLGGKIWVESEIGKGSSFFVSLPRKY